MPKPKNPSQSPKTETGKKNKKRVVKIKPGKSSLGEFVKRSLPTDDEVKRFDEFAEEEVRDEDIEESLSEIYQNEKGDMVDVQKLDIKKSRGFFFWFFSILFIGAMLAGIAYGVYFLYYEKGSSSGDIQFSIEAKEKVLVNEEFFYTVKYINLSNVAVENIEIKLIYPENFIYLDSEPVSKLNNDSWSIDYLEAHRSGLIKIKGKIVEEIGKANIIIGDMRYTPLNFSSEFKKEAAFESSVSGLGIEFGVEVPGGVLVDEENEIIIKYKKEKESFINSFNLSIEPLDNIEFIREEGDEGAWTVSEISEEEQQEIGIKFRVNEKINQTEELTLVFEFVNGEEGNYKFYEEKVNFEVIKSDLNLNLIIEGERNDQGVDLDQTLNYSIVYENKGDADMEDVVIMAVLNGDVLNWDSLKDDNEGKVGDGTITWSKEEIAELGSLSPEEEGIIDFSIDIKSLNGIDLVPGQEYKVESYVQYSVSNIEPEENDDTKSNTIINEVNSDLTLSEQVRYFSDDNIAVGSGPLPPQVGDTTSYKVYWSLTNNLHELNNLSVQVELPDYVSWDNKNRSTIGTIDFDSNTRKVVWNIGRLPISVYKGEAEFNINITPTDEDIDKILVLLSGTKIEANDKETGSIIKKTIKAKTTKLEDDDTAKTDGRIVE